MLIATVTDPRTGATSAIPATKWTPVKRQVFEAAAKAEGLVIVFEQR
jgi:hypothetical protein